MKINKILTICLSLAVVFSFQHDAYAISADYIHLHIDGSALSNTGFSLRGVPSWSATCQGQPSDASNDYTYTCSESYPTSQTISNFTAQAKSEMKCPSPKMPSPCLTPKITTKATYAVETAAGPLPGYCEYSIQQECKPTGKAYSGNEYKCSITFSSKGSKCPLISATTSSSREEEQNNITLTLK